MQTPLLGLSAAAALVVSGLLAFAPNSMHPEAPPSETAPSSDGGADAGSTDQSRAAGLSEGVERARFRWAQTAGGGWALAATFDLTPGWHCYWENPGESGDAPRFELSMPDGWEVRPTIYPRPDAKMLEGVPFYGYEGRATYLIPVRQTGGSDGSGWQSPGGATPGAGGRWRVQAQVMACKSRCTISKASAEGTWPPSAEAGTDVQLNGGVFEGRSLPLTAASGGIYARLDLSKARIEGPLGGRGSARFIPASIPGLQVTMPEGMPAIAATTDGDKFKLECPLESQGVGAGAPALAGLIMLGSSPSDPCIWLTIPHPLAGPDGTLGGNGLGASPDAPPSK